MYTEYPIFPEHEVHIPTSPSYKKALKDALLLFLNKGGNLMDLENELQVSPPFHMYGVRLSLFS